MSCKIIDLGVNRKRICDFLLVINSNFGLTSYRFRDSDVKSWSWKRLVFSTLPCLTPPLWGNRLKFLSETYPPKTRGMVLSYGKNFTILTSTVFDWSTRVPDGQTDCRRRDGRAIAYSVLSIYAVARKKTEHRHLSCSISRVSFWNDNEFTLQRRYELYVVKVCETLQQ